MLLELQEPDIMFLVTGPGSILGGSNFFEKEYFSKFFVAKMKKSSLVITSKNYYISYTFVKRKNRKLRPNLLLRSSYFVITIHVC